MSDWENAIIALDEAHEILPLFGIGQNSRQYQRWRRDDGFRQVDFESVLGESSSVVIVDGRECLQDVMDVIQHQLDELGIETTADLGEEGELGDFRACGQSAGVKFVPEEDDDFDDVISTVNRLIGQTACYRKFRSCEGSDSWSYAVLKNEDWQALEAAAPVTMQLLFM